MQTVIFWQAGCNRNTNHDKHYFWNHVKCLKVCNKTKLASSFKSGWTVISNILIFVCKPMSVVMTWIIWAFAIIVAMYRNEVMSHFRKWVLTKKINVQLLAITKNFENGPSWKSAKVTAILKRWSSVFIEIVVCHALWLLSFDIDARITIK